MRAALVQIKLQEMVCPSQFLFVSHVHVNISSGNCDLKKNYC